MGAALRSLGVLDAYFKQYFWTFHLAVLALAGVLLAKATNTVVGGFLRTPASALASAPVVPSSEPAENTKRSDVPTQAFLEKNVMHAEREDLTPPPPDADTAPKNTFKADNCEKTTLRSKLVGTVVSADPDRSVAVFTDATSAASQGLYVGDKLENAEIKSIEWRRVKVDNLGHCEFFSLEDDQPQTLASAAAAVPPPPAVGDDGEPKIALGENVKQIKEGEYEIPRGEIDNVLSNLNAVATMARIVPSFQNGKANGFKLFSIRPNSLYSKIGIQNGDIVSKINGYEMNSPDKALEIYSKLKDANAITVDIVRRGKTQTLSYQIR
ncbi:MAG: type II secretion system protein GspC [Myxococcota bacterium]